VFLPVTCPAGIAISLVIGLGIALILRRMQTKVPGRGKLITIALKKFHLVR
jgi:NhaP-type Na+/H+ or K+/H+ antiporter